ncbi:MAG: non-canonical purine NTP pyrophosphatase [bacterium]|nr:non-canonical purine NTP pyrophosphatase [bacterium]
MCLDDKSVIKRSYIPKKQKEEQPEKINLLYGTENPSKLEMMRSRLASLPIHLIGLQELRAKGMEIPTVEESGNNPLENAKLKAKAYYEAFHMPVFSCDSGLYFDNLPQELQPGVYVRRIGGQARTDEEMIAYYSGLAKTYGDLTARYKNAICLILDEQHIYESMEPSMESEAFIITAVPHKMRKEGFPLDSLSIEIKSGKYYYDLPETALEQVAVQDGLLEFFQKLLGLPSKEK